MANPNVKFRVPASGPEVVYPLSESGKVLGIASDGTIQPTVLGGVPYVYSGPNVDPATGTHVLLTIPIDTLTDNAVTVSWDCYNGTTNRVMGTTVVQVIRQSGAPTILGNSPGADFVDTTVSSVSPWAPTSVLNGNDLEVSLTADAYNPIVPRVSAHVVSASTANAPPPVDPIAAARAALHATGPTIELYTDEGRIPASSTPGTVVTALADYSGNGHDAAVSGGVTYDPPPSGKPALKYPASGGRVAPAGAIPASQKHTFAFRYTLGDAVGAAVELVLSSLSSPANTFISINWTSPSTGIIRYSNDHSTGYDVGTVQAGTHDYVIVVDDTSVILYVDGVAGAPVACAAGQNSWLTPKVGGGATAANFPLVSGYLQSVIYWGDSSDVATKVSAFDAYCVLAYGAHS